MESRNSSTCEYQHRYKSANWFLLVQRKFLVENSSNLSSTVVTESVRLEPEVILYPEIFPQRSSYSYQNQKTVLSSQLIALRRGISTRPLKSPLPPLLSVHHIQAVSAPRLYLNTNDLAKLTKSLVKGVNGSKGTSGFYQSERKLLAGLVTQDMLPTEELGMPNSSHQHPAPIQPFHPEMTHNQHSNSVPSTPHQHLRKFSFESREPSPSAANNHSPRSAYSESNITLSSARNVPCRGGCRYETALANIKRRMPYSIGSEKLEKLSLSSIKSRLSSEEEKILSTDIQELYQQLLPSPECELRRTKLVCKLERLFNDKWPGHNILVHVFGSSGNSLCTDHSDVDLCITTDIKEMEGVCIIADLLAKNGMQKVICVSTAKVPIVKIWDPELCLACDMNVNNTLALENTRMIKTYVQIDERVRPLAMIIKHWTKKRIVNDAAFGGTLSSYTWICMIINFLQSRSPPILPSLQQKTNFKKNSQNGIESAFSDDIEALRNFGHKNKETLGELLFSFFRFYAHEFDYDRLVISVRHGKQISKFEKGWHLTTNNRLCVEEPFNVSRNLGNTADDTSFRGLHIEMRRAFDLISKAKLQECCEQWMFPPEEEKKIREPTTKAKVVLRNASSSRGGRGGAQRANRHSSQQFRHGSNNNRRASSGAFDGSPFIPGHPPQNISSQETWLQRQAQAQLHNDLYTTYSALQAHENNLRFQLYAQGLHAQAYAQSQAGQSQSHNNRIMKSVSSEQARTTTHEQQPSLTSMRPEIFYYSPHYHGASFYKNSNPTTSPSSASLDPGNSEPRRSAHRSTVTSVSGNSEPSTSSVLRSRSQPGIRNTPEGLLNTSGVINFGLNIDQGFSRNSNGILIPNFIADDNVDSLIFAATPPERSMPMEYVGYYIQENYPNPIPRNTPISMAIPAFGDIGQPKRRHSTDQLTQSHNNLRHISRSPSPVGHNRIGSMSSGHHSMPCDYPKNNSLHQSAVISSQNHVQDSIPSWQAQVDEASGYDEIASGLGSRSVESSDCTIHTSSDILWSKRFSEQVNSKGTHNSTKNDHSLCGNDSNVNLISTVGHSESSTSKTSQAFQINSQNIRTHAEIPNGHNSSLELIRNKVSCPIPNGIISPVVQHDFSRENLSNITPVSENQNSSSVENQVYSLSLDRKSNNDGFLRAGERKAVPVNLNHSSTNSDRYLPSISKNYAQVSKSESESPGSWQQVPWSKKKNSASFTKSLAIGRGQSEILPTNASDRKGG